MAWDDVGEQRGDTCPLTWARGGCSDQTPHVSRAGAVPVTGCGRGKSSGNEQSAGICVPFCYARDLQKPNFGVTKGRLRAVLE